MAKEFDLVVVGAGPVGENVADRAVQDGLTAVIVEAELVGGECSYWACMPSKGLLRSGAALRETQSVDGARQALTGTLDVEAVLRRRDSLTSEWDDSGQVSWLESAGIELVRGHGRLTAPREVTVEHDDGSTTVLHARHAVAICTGTDARVPRIPGLAEARPWTSREATSAHEIPGRLAIIGGGVVAAEMATAFNDLGSDVTVIARHGLLEKAEPFAGRLVTDALRARGVTVHESAQANRVERLADGSVQLDLSRVGGADDASTGTMQQLTVDEVLVATGRSPRTSDIGIDVVGLSPGEPLTVDDTMLVQGDHAHLEGEWLYAVGDVNHRAPLTHEGKYQARAAGDAIAARAAAQTVDARPWSPYVATADHGAVPQVVFTDPEVAWVGLTAASAEKAGYSIRSVDYDMASVAGASVFSDNYVGKARMVVDEERGTLLGVTFVGPQVGELLHAATIAIVGEVPIDRLWHAVPAFPTVSEVWLRLLEAYGRPTAHDDMRDRA